MMGSGVFANVFPLEVALAAKDVQGKVVRDELRAIGYDGPLPVGGRPVAAYFEAHIEQGPVLEDQRKVIGVVEAVLGLRWYDCVVTGLESHAGATPHDRRKDALQVATRVMQEVVALAERAAPHGRGTVGFVQVHPNSRNVIPGRVTFSIDLRNVDVERHDRMDRDLRAFAEKVQGETGLRVELTEVSYNRPVQFHETCVSAVRIAATLSGSSSPARPGAPRPAPARCRAVAGTPGSSRGGWWRCASRSGRARGSSASRCSSASATTSSPRRRSAKGPSTRRRRRRPAARAPRRWRAGTARRAT
jgi:N-carbamoyl-L-amino-acid hydrolase